jgi:hypothetical protein
MIHRRASRRTAAIAVLAAALVSAPACRQKAEPVASLSVEPKDVRLPAGRATAWKLTWSPKAPLDNLEGKPRVFVHVLASDRNLLRTFDHPLAEEWAPWKAQSYEVDLYQSALAEPLAAGAYEVTAGLYDDGSGERWPLEVAGDEVGKREYRVGTLVVPPDEAGTPAYKFSGGWLDAEPGGSKQVLARRCARGEATIGVGGVASAGTLVVGSSVPKLASGAWGGAVAVTSSCSGDRAEIKGPELQWTRIPVAPAAGEPACEVRFTPVPPASGGNERSICVEVLAWRPAGG